MKEKLYYVTETPAEGTVDNPQVFTGRTNVIGEDLLLEEAEALYYDTLHSWHKNGGDVRRTTFARFYKLRDGSDRICAVVDIWEH